MSNSRTNDKCSSSQQVIHISACKLDIYSRFHLVIIWPLVHLRRRAVLGGEKEFLAGEVGREGLEDGDEVGRVEVTDGLEVILSMSGAAIRAVVTREAASLEICEKCKNLMSSSNVSQLIWGEVSWKPN